MMNKMIVSVLAVLAAGMVAAADFRTLGTPDSVRVECAEGNWALTCDGQENWARKSLRVGVRAAEDVRPYQSSNEPAGRGRRPRLPAVELTLAAPSNAVKVVRFFWACDLKGTKVLRDAWERTNGDSGWHDVADVPNSPWYFLVNAEGRTDGYGLMTQPNAFGSWNVTTRGFELVLDVSAGGRGVKLGGRQLTLCTLVSRKGAAGESAFQAGRAFCKMMCPKPRLPKTPVLGYNDWYCAYGSNTATNFLADAKYVVSLAEGTGVRPYVVMDDGWQPNAPPVLRKRYGRGSSGWGPWGTSGESFGMEMTAFAKEVRNLGANPGLWYRPFRAWDEIPEAQRRASDPRYFDPSLPETLAQVKADVARFRAWGFALAKIDYIAYDITDTWGGQYGETVFTKDLQWKRDDRTGAEVVRGLYAAMREAAGDDLAIIGCNAFNHFAAGLFEMQRTGGDTSGWKWEQTRQMGVNTLGARAIQDRAFFAVDADCAGLAKAGAVPWEKNRQWIDALGKSGTPIFISWHRSLADASVRAALSAAFRAAAAARETAEPLDWLETRFPAKWRAADGTETTYNWD